MNDQSNQYGGAASQQRGGRPARRPARRRSVMAASAAAVDEVFAGLARMEPAHASGRATPPRVIDPAEVRNLADQLDRQHERLARLLRDLDGGIAASV
jgi:hypothetical protein